MPATITIHYQGSLQLITKKPFELMSVDDHLKVEMLLALLFFRYPHILIRELPESMQVFINGDTADGRELLTDGDTVRMTSQTKIPGDNTIKVSRS